MARKVGQTQVTWVGEDDPKSLFSLLRAHSVFMASCEQIDSSLMEKSERQLENEIRKVSEDKKFPRQLGYIKIRFWEEYRAAQMENRTMVLADIYQGICHGPWFHKNVLENPLNLAWLIHPPTDELVAQKEILQLAMNKLRDVFDADIFHTKVKVVVKGGERREIMTKEINLPLVKEIHGILQTMQNRVYGSVLQRSKNETTTKNLNIHAAAGVYQASPGAPRTLNSPDLTLEELAAFGGELAKLQKKLELSAPAVLEEDKEKAIDA